MTPSEWLTCTDPARMLEHVEPGASERKLRLFASACCRRIWHLLPEADSRFAVEAAERYADGLAGHEELEQAGERGKRATWAAVAAAHAGRDGLRTEAAQASWVAVWAACAAESAAGPDLRGPGPLSAALRTAQVASWARSVACDSGPLSALDIAPPGAREEPEEACQADLLRDLFGEHTAPPHLRPEWLRWNDGCVVKMARSIYAEGRFSDLPILADALEDAGCDDPRVLEHCRRPRLHTRGCWLLDGLMGKG
jgi:hypothetical protein